jgi:sensor histidine kinase YesM
MHNRSIKVLLFFKFILLIFSEVVLVICLGKIGCSSGGFSSTCLDLVLPSEFISGTP